MPNDVEWDPAIAPKSVMRRHNESVKKQALFSMGLSEDTMGAFVADQMAQGNYTGQDLEVINHINGQLGKGALIGPFTLAPDLLGIAATVANWGQEVAADKMGIDRSEIWKIPVISGDPIRELVGGSADDVNMMIGEMFGNWESALAKGGVFAAKAWGMMVDYAPQALLLYAMKQKPVSGVARMWMGPFGGSNLRGDLAIERMDEAARRLAAGENQMTVLRETGWTRGGDGKMKFIVSDKHTVINEEAVIAKAKEAFTPETEKKVIDITLNELFDAPIIYKAYPELADLPVKIRLRLRGFDDSGSPIVEYWWRGQDPYGFGDISKGDKAGFEIPRQDLPRGRIHTFNLKNAADLRSSILHEIQHAIQKIEGFSAGADNATYTRMVQQFDFTRDQSRMLDAISARTDAISAARGDDDYLAITREIFEELGLANDPTIPERVKAHIAQEIYVNVEDWQLMSEIERMDLVNATDNLMYQTEEWAADGLRLGSMSTEDMIEVLNNSSWDDLAVIAQRRYLAQGGEMEARVTQALRDKTLEEIYKRIEQVGGDPLEVAWRSDAKLAGLYGPVRGKHARFEGDTDVTISRESLEGLDLSEEEVQFIQNLIDRDPTLLSKLGELLNSANPGSVEKATTGFRKMKSIRDVYIKTPGPNPKKMQVEVLENPSKQEVIDFMNQSDSTTVRYLTTEDNVWIWDADDAIHYDVGQALGVDMNRLELDEANWVHDADLATLQDLLDMFF